jgi:hypothetical protein
VFNLHFASCGKKAGAYDRKGYRVTTGSFLEASHVEETPFLIQLEDNLAGLRPRAFYRVYFIIIAISRCNFIEKM